MPHFFQRWWCGGSGGWDLHSSAVISHNALSMLYQDSDQMQGIIVNMKHNKYIIHWCILIWKSKHIRCEFIDEYPPWVQFSSNPRKVPSLRVDLPHSLWGQIEVLPPVESRLEPLNSSEELIKVVLFCCWRRIVYHECDVAGVSAIVWAQPDVISPHKTSLRCVCNVENHQIRRWVYKLNITSVTKE